MQPADMFWVKMPAWLFYLHSNSPVFKIHLKAFPFFKKTIMSVEIDAQKKTANEFYVFISGHVCVLYRTLYGCSDVLFTEGYYSIPQPLPNPYHF